jgi:NitT/TauT family transport system substrate-binding protein
MRQIHSRRGFLAGLSSAGIAGAFPLPSASAAEQAPLETTTVRIADFPGGICTAPQYIAEELLRQDGFSEVVQVPMGKTNVTAPFMERDEVDFGLDLATALAIAIDTRKPITALAGVHVGCFILFAQHGINSILDLKGRRVGIGPTAGSDPQIYVSAMATYVGLDPRTDIEWVQSDVTPVKLFEQGKVDALLSFPPEAQELRRRKIGHVVVNSMLDHPWSQYFCCMLVGRPAFVQSYPNATKRVIRAILKATDLCISDPQRAVRILVDKGYATPEQYEDALEALTEIPYTAWREFDPEDTVRFYALRLLEAGLIRSSPQEIIAKGTDWSLVKEIKRELKA